MLLSGTSDLIQIVTNSTGNIDVVAEYADLLTGVVTPDRLLTKITAGAPTTTTVVGSPAASTKRKVKELLISNNHASTSNLISIQQYDGTNTVVIDSVNLLAGERIRYREATGFTLIGSDGVEKPSSINFVTPGNANTADVTANAADTYLTGSNFNVAGRIKAGTILKWRFSFTKTAAGVVAPIFVIRAGTAGTTADTARVTVTAALAQTAAVDTGWVDLEAVVLNAGASGQLAAVWKMGHSLATTGVATAAQDQLQQVTSATFDLTVANLLLGVSVNPGTAGVWTFKTVSVEAINLIK